MRTAHPLSPDDEVFSPAEVAHAAGVSVRRVRDLLRDGQVVAFRNYVPRAEAIRLVRTIRGFAPATQGARPPLTLPRETRRRSGLSLVASGAIHVGILMVFVLVTSLGLLNANETEQVIKDVSPIRLVYLMTPGPGGGGGGGGLKMPEPPARAARRAPPKIVRKISSPIPPVRKAPPPRPVVVDIPKPVVPPKVEPPKPAPAVQAPVVPAPTDATDKVGLLNQASALSSSPGSGSGGGVGSGVGTGMGEGRGAGIGPGSGGGTGGGPFQPGAGIEPPTLLREIKPLYTDEARKRAVEGNVVLEIVVRRDGSVGNPRVTRSLGAGLDERAIDAVRQWRFGPARRQGSPVDVVVEVSVEFKLR
jgi:protein TonB